MFYEIEYTDCHRMEQKTINFYAGDRGLYLGFTYNHPP